MKKQYSRPTLLVERFELSQHVAAGCTTSTITVPNPGGSVTGDWQCARGGNGHWHASGVTVVDDNCNGVIDWDEIVKYVGTADNGVQTGSGHKNHGVALTSPSKEETIVTLNS